MKLEIKFGAGYERVSFDPCGEKPQILLRGYPYPEITDANILEKFAFFFKNISFPFWYTESWYGNVFKYCQDIQTQFSTECLENFDRNDLDRLTSFVSSITMADDDEESLPVKFFIGQDEKCFAMQGNKIVGILGPSSFFIERQNRNSFVFAQKQGRFEKPYLDGAFTPVFEALL